jgi:hypothetical protein
VTAIISLLNVPLVSGTLNRKPPICNNLDISRGSAPGPGRGVD